jgi:hypothetical protein
VVRKMACVIFAYCRHSASIADSNDNDLMETKVSHTSERQNTFIYEEGIADFLPKDCDGGTESKCAKQSQSAQ